MEANNADGATTLDRGYRAGIPGHLKGLLVIVASDGGVSSSG